MAAQRTNDQKPRQTESAIAPPTVPRPLNLSPEKKFPRPNGFSRRTRLSHEILPTGHWPGRRPWPVACGLAACGLRLAACGAAGARAALASLLLPRAGGRWPGARWDRACSRLMGFIGVSGLRGAGVSCVMCHVSCAITHNRQRPAMISLRWFWRRRAHSSPIYRLPIN
jgi:hypothetical protein